MVSWIALVMLALAVLGLCILFVIGLSVRRQMRETPRQPTKPLPPISILKPLCGVDDDLEESLELFATLDYPDYELVLGLREETDPAWAVATRAAQKWPGRVRVVIQNGEPGFNPKVNQLITLTEAARHDILVVSDSNSRVPPGYLKEMAAHFEDEDVACVTNPVAGQGELCLGALLDNFHLSTSVGPGQIASYRIAHKDLVIGKSMALRRGDLEALGGFMAFKDLLAEDYVTGYRVRYELHKRVVVAHLPVLNYSQRRTVGDFLRRYVRWAIIQRTAVAPITYLAQALLNPAPLAFIGASLDPSLRNWSIALYVIVGRALVDYWVAANLRGRAFSARALLVTPLKDFFLFCAWFYGLYSSTLTWRGNRLRVITGSRLVPISGEQAAEPEVPTQPV